MAQPQFQPTAQRSTPRAAPHVGHIGTAVGRSGADRPQFDFILPSWVDNLEGRLILSNIQADPPEFVANLDTLEAAQSGVGRYRGRYVRQLRKLFEPAERAQMDFCDAARPDMDLYRQRRAAFLAWVGTHGPDAVIDKLVDEVVF